MTRGQLEHVIRAAATIADDPARLATMELDSAHRAALEQLVDAAFAGARHP